MMQQNLNIMQGFSLFSKIVISKLSKMHAFFTCFLNDSIRVTEQILNIMQGFSLLLVCETFRRYYSNAKRSSDVQTLL